MRKCVCICFLSKKCSLNHSSSRHRQGNHWSSTFSLFITSSRQKLWFQENRWIRSTFLLVVWETLPRPAPNLRSVLIVRSWRVAGYVGLFAHWTKEDSIWLSYFSPNQCSFCLLLTEHHCPDHLRNWISANWSKLLGTVLVYQSLELNKLLIILKYVQHANINKWSIVALSSILLSRTVSFPSWSTWCVPAQALLG